MGNILKKETIVFKWDIFSLFLLVFVFILQIIKLPSYPLFLDAYYHLSVMLGFDQSGGYTTHAFWEAAPFGRAHLYPPLLHIVMLLFYKLGLSKLAILKAMDFVLYPAGLFIIWFIFRKIISKSFAFFALLTAASSYTFYLSFVNTHAASLALLICLGTFYHIYQRKIPSSVMLFGLSFYAHLGISGLFMIVFVIYGLLNRDSLKYCLFTVLGGVVIALPMLIYFYNFRGYFQFYALAENYQIVINLLIYLAAFLGLGIFLRKKKSYSFFLALSLGMLPMVFNYRFRYFCFQGLLAYVLLCSVFLNEACLRIKGRIGKDIFIFGAIILLFFVSPVLNIGGNTIKADIFGSNLAGQFKTFNILKGEQANRLIDKINLRNITVYDYRLFNEIVEIIKDNSDKDDIIYSDFNYAGGGLGAFSGRAISHTMFREIKPFKDSDPVACAKIIILFKEQDGFLGFKSIKLINRYKLEHIADTDLVSIYLNPSAEGKRNIAPPVISTPILFAVFFIYVLLLVILSRKKRKGMYTPIDSLINVTEEGRGKSSCGQSEY